MSLELASAALWSPPLAATQYTMHPTLLAPPVGVKPMGRGSHVAKPGQTHGQRFGHHALAVVHRPHAWLQDRAPSTRVWARKPQDHLSSSS